MKKALGTVAVSADCSKLRRLAIDIAHGRLGIFVFRQP